MTVNYNNKMGVDLPSWQWLNQFVAGNTYHGTSHAYDGSRYIYWAVQFGSASAASTTQLWRFDTWTNGWQFLTALAVGYAGIDIELDVLHNVLWIGIGNTGTAWYCFNVSPNLPVTIGTMVVALQPLALSAALVALPATMSIGSDLEMPSDLNVPPAIVLGGSGVSASTATTGSTSTTLNDTSTTTEFSNALTGCHIRFTSGALNNQSRPIATVPTINQITVGTAFSAAPAAGDSYVIEAPGNGAAGGLPVAAGATTTAMTYTSAGWTVNVYRDSDVVILTGTGAGQRRRIASNTANTLTLAAVTTGNARTGPFTTAPDATSTFAIVPSNDFLWYATGTNTNLYRLDVNATTPAWATYPVVAPAQIAGASHLVHSASFAPFCLHLFRGASTSSVYRLNIGLQTWVTLPAFWGGDAANFTTGGSVVAFGQRQRFLLHMASTQRIYIYNPNTGVLDSAGMMPYAAPAAYDGKRLCHIRTVDGVDFIYILRAGGQEFFRMPIVWSPV